MKKFEHGNLIPFLVFLSVGYVVMFSPAVLDKLGLQSTWMSNANTSQATMAGRDEQAAVKKAIETFRQGMIKRRPELIIESSAPKLTFGHSNGVVQSREEFAEVVRSGSEIFKRVDLTDQNLVISGNTAVERHHFSADIVYQGELMNFELEVVEIWQKTDKWRLIARQALKT